MMSSNSELELSVTRFIDASPEGVYRVYTERTAEWWVPKPWTTPAVEWDLRTGGRMYTEMRGPDGEGESGEGVFLEVVPGEHRLDQRLQARLAAAGADERRLRLRDGGDRHLRAGRSRHTLHGAGPSLGP